MDYVEPVRVVAPPVYTARDPFRQIDNVVYNVDILGAARGWVEFSGRIWNVQSGGVCIKGSYTGSGAGPDGGGENFFVANFPYEVADDEAIGRTPSTLTFYCAKMDGTYTYPTAAGGTKTLHKLDYGKIYVAPPATPEQIEAAKKAAAAAKLKAQSAKQAAADRALALNEAAAATNSPYGLMRMGERYRDGDGVDKDPVRAKDYLQRAADLGSPTASDELKLLH